MAPSSNYTLMAFLVAFAVVAPSLLHQSAAARDGGAAKAAAAPAPSSANDGGEVVAQPAATYEIPDLPLPAILPCPPLFPKIPFIPCYSPPPPPPPRELKECRPSMTKLVPPCSGFLHNSSSAAFPSDECCAAANLFMAGGDGSISYSLCVCHVLNGDINQLLTAPAYQGRVPSLVHTCVGLDPRQWTSVCSEDDIKALTPPMDLPTPAPGNKAN